MSHMTTKEQITEIREAFAAVAKPAKAFAWKAMAVGPTVGILLGDPKGGLLLGILFAVGVPWTMVSNHIQANIAKEQAERQNAATLNL